jgi:hypothetical protein
VLASTKLWIAATAGNTKAALLDDEERVSQFRICSAYSDTYAKQAVLSHSALRAKMHVITKT